LNSIESDSHSHEEESTIPVLDTLGCSIAVLEKNDGEASSDNGNDELNVWSLGKSDSVEEVSLNEKTKLVEPTNLLIVDISISNRSDLWMSEGVVVL
jgi:hypothetical protein